MESYFINLNQKVDNLVNRITEIIISDQELLKFILKLILYALLIIILLYVIHYILRFIVLLFRKTIKKAPVIMNEISEQKYLDAKLVSQKEVLSHAANIFKKSKYEKWNTLFASGILLAINKEYLNDYFSDGVFEIAMDQNIVDLKDTFKIEFLDLLVIPNQLTRVKVKIINSSSNDKIFNMPKTRFKSWSNMYLINQDNSRYLIEFCDSSQNEYLLEGGIVSGESFELSLFYKTVSKKDLRKIKAIAITGFLKVKGTKKEYLYENKIEINKPNHSKKIGAFLKNSFKIEELFDLMKEGGLTYFSNLILLTTSFTLFFTTNLIIKTLVFFLNLTVFVYFTFLNKKLIEHIHNVTQETLNESFEKIE